MKRRRRHTLWVRATDTQGNRQPTEQEWNLQGMGNNMVQQVEVLVEGPSKRNQTRYCGRTPDGRIAVFPAGLAEPGQIVRLTVTSMSALTLFCLGPEETARTHVNREAG